MNAYQLADELQKMFVGEEYDRLVHEIPDLLRQQAKEIAILKQIIDANNLQSDIGQFIRPIYEPVAHRFKWDEKEEWQYGDGYDATGAPNDPDYFAYEPLYTHPAKTLTNEEIKTIYYETGDLFDFANAILRKAHEK